jgi:hypothetical protein
MSNHTVVIALNKLNANQRKLEHATFKMLNFPAAAYAGGTPTQASPGIARKGCIAEEPSQKQQIPQNRWETATNAQARNAFMGSNHEQRR